MSSGERTAERALRLLIVSQYFWPENFRVNDLVAELVERGHDVTVLTGQPNYPGGAIFPEFRANPRQFAQFAGARVLRVPVIPRGSGKVRLVLNYLSFAVSATIGGVVRLRREHFDAMFVFQTSPVTVGLPAVALRKLKGWPIAFWVLDQWPETLAAIGVVTSKVGIAAVARLVTFIYSRCDVLLSPSRSLIPQIQSYARGTPVDYFPNWIESTYGGQHDAAAAPEVPPANGTISVMFAGNIGEAQDFPTILDAASRLRERDDIRWLIVGDGRMGAWAREEVARRDLSHRVFFFGQHPPERMPSFFRHASALLVSLRPDPLFTLTAPGKLQTYLASGLPVIAMLDGEGAAVVEAARAGLTCPAGSAEALAASVTSLAAMSESERMAMGSHGTAYAASEFGRERLMDRLERIMTRISRPR